MKPPRQTVGYVVGWIILSPLLPLFVIREGAAALVRFLDWLVEGRSATRFLLRIQERVELWSLQ